jgi:carboxylesterase type B
VEVDSFNSHAYVYVCVKLPEATTDTAKPVMVWIHGGGFYIGSGNTDFYGPDHLISEDVVLVTFNYRLGALGNCT